MLSWARSMRQTIIQVPKTIKTYLAVLVYLLRPPTSNLVSHRLGLICSWFSRI
jgi:hypothetical protein